MLTRDQERLKSAASFISHPLNGEDWGLLELCFSEGLSLATLGCAIPLSELFPKKAKDWDTLQFRAYCNIQMLKQDTEKAWNWYNLAVCFAKTCLSEVVGWQELFPVKAKGWDLAQLMAYCFAESLVIDPYNDDAWDGLANCFFARASIADLPASFVPMIYSCIQNDAPANLYCTVYCLEKAIIYAQDEDKKRQLQGKYHYAKNRLIKGPISPTSSTKAIIDGLSDLSLVQSEEFIPFKPKTNTNTNTNTDLTTLAKRKADYGIYSVDSFSAHRHFSLLNKMPKWDIGTLPSTKTEMEASILKSNQRI